MKVIGTSPSLSRSSILWDRFVQEHSALITQSHIWQVLYRTLLSLRQTSVEIGTYTGSIQLHINWNPLSRFYLAMRTVIFQEDSTQLCFINYTHTELQRTTGIWNLFYASHSHIIIQNCSVSSPRLGMHTHKTYLAIIHPFRPVPH